MTRRARLLALLWTRNDSYPGLRGSLNPARGLAASVKVPCPDCTGGWVTDRFKRERPCVSCGGKDVPSGKHGQWLKDDAGRGWVQTDPMDADHAPVQTSDVSARPTKPSRMVTCDACEGSGVGGAHLRDLADPSSEYRDPCRYCAGSGKRAVAVFDLQLEQERSDQGTALEAAIDRRRDTGSYHELDQALQVLPARWRTLLLAVHADRVVTERELDGWEHAMLEAALVVVEQLMPATIRVPASVKAAVKHATEREGRTLANGRGAGKLLTDRRDKEIRRLVRQGRPTQWVAGEYALSVASVNRIVNGETEAA